MNAAQRVLRMALEQVYAGDQSIEAGCVLDAITDAGYALVEQAGGRGRYGACAGGPAGSGTRHRKAPRVSSARKLAVVLVALVLCAVLTVAATSPDPAMDVRVTTPTTTEPVAYAP